MNLNTENYKASTTEEIISVLYFILGAIFYLCNWNILMWIAFVKGILDLVCAFYFAYKESLEEFKEENKINEKKKRKT